MEKFYLEKPTINRKDDVIEYIKEHIDTNSKINGTGGLNRLVKGISYEEWLDDVIKSEDIEYTKLNNFVPSSTYFTIRESDNKIIGMINFRHYLNEKLSKSCGHIGYGIRPKERRKGYAKIQLYLALLVAKELKIDKVMISCEESNIASEKTILALNGKFDRIEYEENMKRNLKIHWINVDESINKYQEYYKSKIKK